MLALVWAALNDPKAILQAGYQEPPEMLVKQRQASFLSCLQQLQQQERCHQGIRHELVFLLNKIYPGIELIEDEDLTVLYIIREALIQKISLAAVDKMHGLRKVLLDWLFDKEKDIRPMITFLNLNENLLQDLEDLFLRHCYFTKSLHVLYENALSAIDFPGDKEQFPGLYYACLILELVDAAASQELITF